MNLAGWLSPVIKRILGYLLSNEQSYRKQNRREQVNDHILAHGGMSAGTFSELTNTLRTI